MAAPASTRSQGFRKLRVSRCSVQCSPLQNRMLTRAHRMDRTTTGSISSRVTRGMDTVKRVGSTPIRADTPKAAMAAVMQGTRPA